MMPKSMNVPGINPTDSEIEYWEQLLKNNTNEDEHPKDCKCIECFPPDFDDIND
jgi:hypothetical protein